MSSVLSLAWELAKVAGKGGTLLGIIGLVWAFAVAQTPGNLPFF